MWKALRKFHLWLDVVAFLIMLALALRFGDRTKFWYAGVALATICLPLWIAARIQLGSAFTIKPEARQLVTCGLYSKLQHPIYFFGSGASLGALLALQLWPLLAVWLALLPLQILRAHRESQLLNAKFGEQYERYRRSTWL